MITEMVNGVNDICTHREDGGNSRKPGIHEEEWIKAGHDRWTAFTKANPDLSLTRGLWKPTCFEALTKLHYSCRHHERLNSGGILDHWHTVQVGYKEVAVVSQPYYYEAPQFQEDLRRHGLDLVNAGEDRSWYFPGASSLILIGRAESISKVHVAYDVSGCAPLPAGCRQSPPERGLRREGHYPS